MLADLRHLSRNLRRSPASAGAAVVTLSLTLGAGASIFAVVDAVLLTPPPFTNPDALVSSCIVVVRSARPDADVIAAVREEVGRLDGNLPVYGVRSMQDVVAASPGMSARRVLTATFMGFALLALVLGAIGLFGVVAHDVASRRAELALRIALGADPMRIVTATLGQGAWMVGSGLAVGGVLSIWAARSVSGLVFGIGHIDVLSVAMPAALLIAAGAAAVLPAARRAARTDPLIVLRSE